MEAQKRSRATSSPASHESTNKSSRDRESPTSSSVPSSFWDDPSLQSQPYHRSTPEPAPSRDPHGQPGSSRRNTRAPQMTVSRSKREDVVGDTSSEEESLEELGRRAMRTSWTLLASAPPGQCPRNEGQAEHSRAPPMQPPPLTESTILTASSSLVAIRLLQSAPHVIANGEHVLPKQPTAEDRTTGDLEMRLSRTPSPAVASARRGGSPEPLTGGPRSATLWQQHQPSKQGRSSGENVILHSSQSSFPQDTVNCVLFVGDDDREGSWTGSGIHPRRCPSPASATSTLAPAEQRGGRLPPPIMGSSDEDGNKTPASATWPPQGADSAARRPTAVPCWPARYMDATPQTQKSSPHHFSDGQPYRAQPPPTPLHNGRQLPVASVLKESNPSPSPPLLHTPPQHRGTFLHPILTSPLVSPGTHLRMGGGATSATTRSPSDSTEGFLPSRSTSQSGTPQPLLSKVPFPRGAWQAPPSPPRQQPLSALQLQAAVVVAGPASHAGSVKSPTRRPSTEVIAKAVAVRPVASPATKWIHVDDSDDPEVPTSPSSPTLRHIRIEPRAFVSSTAAPVAFLFPSDQQKCQALRRQLYDDASPQATQRLPLQTQVLQYPSQGGSVCSGGQPSPSVLTPTFRVRRALHHPHSDSSVVTGKKRTVISFDEEEDEDEAQGVAATTSSHKEGILRWMPGDQQKDAPTSPSGRPAPASWPPSLPAPRTASDTMVDEVHDSGTKATLAPAARLQRPDEAPSATAFARSGHRHLPPSAKFLLSDDDTSEADKNEEAEPSRPPSSRDPPDGRKTSAVRLGVEGHSPSRSVVDRLFRTRRPGEGPLFPCDEEARGPGRAAVGPQHRPRHAAQQQQQQTPSKKTASARKPPTSSATTPAGGPPWPMRPVDHLLQFYPARYTRKAFMDAVAKVVPPEHFLAEGEFWHAMESAEFIGEGSFGLVWRCRTINGDLVAVKSCPISLAARANIEDSFSTVREIAVMRFLNERGVPYVLPLHSAFFVKGSEALPPLAAEAFAWRRDCTKRAEARALEKQVKLLSAGRSKASHGGRRHCVAEEIEAQLRLLTGQEGPAARARRARLQGVRLPSFLSISEEDTRRGDATMFLVTELCDGDVERVPLQEGVVKGVAYCISAALAAMHSLGLLHLDLKPSNILFAYEHGPSQQHQPPPPRPSEQHQALADGTATIAALSDLKNYWADAAGHREASPPQPSSHPAVKFYLSDFGNCRVVGPEATHVVSEAYGTYEYMDLRALRDAVCSRATDAFSLGCSLYEMLFRKRVYPKCTNPACSRDDEHTRACFVEAASQPIVLPVGEVAFHHRADVPNGTNEVQDDDGRLHSNRTPPKVSLTGLQRCVAALLSADEATRMTAAQCRNRLVEAYAITAADDSRRGG